ncbi:MAG: hypothetical protein Q8O70_00305 [Burkholderiales bacterium]|nr:hypothetical protein [Burkholderiales bacterium]
MKLIALVAFAFVTLVSGAALAEDAAVVRVESKYVCMINDTLFPRAQIPVAVGGKCEARRFRAERVRAVDQLVEAGGAIVARGAHLGPRMNARLVEVKNPGELTSLRAHGEMGAASCRPRRIP